jgi:hypothetical protein
MSFCGYGRNEGKPLPQVSLEQAAMHWRHRNPAKSLLSQSRNLERDSAFLQTGKQHSTKIKHNAAAR